MVRVKCDVRDVRTLNYVRAKPTAVIKQQLVEVGSSDLVAVPDTQVRVVGETKRRGRPVLIRDELCTGFVYTYASDLVGHAQKIKQGQVERQQRFADMETRKMLFLQQDNGFTLPSEQRRDRGASGAATNHNDIALSTIFHCRCRLRTADWESA